MVLESSNATEETDTVLTGNWCPSADLNHVEIGGDTDMDVNVQQLSCISAPSQDTSQEFLNEPTEENLDTFEPYSKEVMIGDLIDLDDPLPISNRPPISNTEGIQNNSIHTVGSVQPPLSPPENLSCPAEPQYELLMYKMMLELYTRTCCQV